MGGGGIRLPGCQPANSCQLVHQGRGTIEAQPAITNGEKAEKQQETRTQKGKKNPEHHHHHQHVVPPLTGRTVSGKIP